MNEVSVTPPPPPAGSLEMYAKTDDVMYIQDSSGNEVPIGTPDAITDLTGDVTASGPGSVVATVVSVGGSLAAAINSATILANNATALNTPSQIVRRDASGNFAAGTITANITGNVNGVDPAAHASRHLPSGADPITTAAPITNLDATTTNAVGTANSLARSDHSHAISTGVVSTILPDQANAAGTSANLARADHIHNVPSGAVVQIGTSNFAGAAASFALSDHVHAHGNQTSGSLHAVVTSLVNGFMITTDKIKLDAATNLNTPSTIVMRDASGNFSAGMITANLTGNVTGNVSGSSGTFTGSLSGDVTGTQSATVIAVGAVTDTKASLANKPAVTVVATTNQTLSGLPTIDSQATAVGSLILATAQTTGSENGPWVAAAGAWSRPTWYPSGGTTQAFQFITTLIRLGATYRGTTWRMTTAGPITIDTTATTWVVTPIALNPSTIDGGKITATFLNRVVTLTDAATIAVDASLGNTFDVTLGGNRTLGAPTNPINGQKVTFRIRQDATGGRTLAFDAIYRFGLDLVSFTASTAANKLDYIGCIYNGADTKWDVVAVSKGFN